MSPLRRAFRRTTRFWRRSLQLRVVATTLLLSAAVVAAIGFVLVQQVGRGLLEAKTRAALAEASSGLTYAQNQLSSSDRTDPASVDQLLEDLTQSLADRGSPAGLYDVVLFGTASTSSGFASEPVETGDIPEKLRQRVARDGGKAYEFTTLRRGTGAEPGLVVGGSLRAPTDTFQLYYLFPLTPETQTLSLVRRILAFAGFALVVLLAALAALVTRQVVSPVRIAARTAERLSAGRLEERMAVRGEDDLARLAVSFNRMAGSLQQQIRQLEELSRLQQRFVADVSHELRTPLTTVRLAADVLHSARPGFAPQVARSAELLQTELDRFEALLADLLEISRFDAQAVILEPEAVDLGELVRGVVEAAEPLAIRHGSVLDLSGVPGVPVVAEVDPRRVQRVLRNLVANAVEYGEGRPVAVALAAGDGAVAVTVRDHGVGLRPGESALAFNRFWRADPSRTRNTGGTGLGLAIALEDARLHGGWLEAWGSLGAGAQFRLTLPIKAGAPVVQSPLPLEPDDAAGRPRTAARSAPPAPPVTPAPPLAAPGAAPSAPGTPPVVPHGHARPPVTAGAGTRPGSGSGVSGGS